jgi:hypothetical protein
MIDRSSHTENQALPGLRTGLQRVAGDSCPIRHALFISG